MNEIIQSLEAVDIITSKENYCRISESDLLVMKEVSKREKEEHERCVAKNRELDSNNRLLAQQLKEAKKENQTLRKRVKELENNSSDVEQMMIGDVL